jgi:hypothetical protein
MNQPVKLHVPSIAANDDAGERRERHFAFALALTAIGIAMVVLFVFEERLLPEERFGFFESMYTAP